MFGRLSKKDIAVVFGTAFVAAKLAVKKEDVKRKTSRKNNK